MAENTNNPQRPAGVPEGYEQIAIGLPDGRTLLAWARITHTLVRGQRDKISLDILPETVEILPEK